MKKIIMMLVAVLMSTTAALAQVDKIVGEWKTVDDETGKTLSVVKIYKQNNLYYGKIIKLFAADANKKNLGLVVVKDMKEKKGELTGGKIYDPKSGNTYHASIKYNSKKNCLVLRGSIDKYGLIGRSQTWVK
jgi:uncharacterized protein (DUF2147 family)